MNDVKLYLSKYNDAIARKLKCSTKPQPWLHIIMSVTTYRYADNSKDLFFDYAIYVWDTRQVVEVKHQENSNVESMQDFKQCFQRPIDNKQQLKGLPSKFAYLNDKFKA